MLTGTGVADLPVDADDALATDAGADQVPTAATAGSSEHPWWRDLATWAVVLALLVWARPVTHATGGRDLDALTYGLLGLIPAVALVRPWRSLGRLDLVAFAPAAAALVACLVAPTGFDGLDATVAFAYAALMFVVVRGYLGGPSALARRTRTIVVVTAVLLTGLDQFYASWLAWSGSKDSATQMVGTFFWHNQFAAFMAVVGIFGAVVAARGAGRLRWLAGAVAVCAVPSLAFAASRATLALFVLAWIAIAVVSLRRPRALITLVVIPVVGVVAMLALASPVMMPDSHGVSDNVANRDESAVGNGSARLDYDRAALQLVARHPLTGTGFGSFAEASRPLLPARVAQPTVYVHNGLLQGFVDGGVLLGGAVLLAALLPLWVGVRRAWRLRLGRRGDHYDAVSLASFAAVGVLVAHSLVDMDWVYPSFLVLFAILAALLTRPLPAGDPTTPLTTSDAAGTARRTTLVLGVVTVAVLAVAIPASVRVTAVLAPRNDLPSWATVVALGLPVEHPPAWAAGTQACVDGLRAANADTDATTLRHDVDCTARIGAIEPSTQMYRASALMRLGERARAEAMADDLATRYGDRIPQILVLRAALPADAGDRATALRQVTAILSDPRVQARPQAEAYATAVRDQLSAR